jgi:hypothetical protein
MIAFRFVALATLLLSQFVYALPAHSESAFAKRQNERKQGDPQKSTTLDPKSIMKSLKNNGVVNGAGTASLTSENNFINFCLTQKKPLTEGQQIKDGSCNPVPMGRIIQTDKMPNSRFTNPKNLDTIPANKPFEIRMAIKNLQTGAFTNAQTTYFSAPAQTNGNGVLIGHSHVVIQKIDDLKSTKTLDPNTFAFFKGFNDPAKGGVLTAQVDKGLPAGVYRMGSINTAANHQPALVAVAQHGMIDDVVYFTAK